MERMELFWRAHDDLFFFSFSFLNSFFSISLCFSFLLFRRNLLGINKRETTTTARCPGNEWSKTEKGKNAFTDRSDKQQKTLIAIIFPDSITQFFSFLFFPLPFQRRKKRRQRNFFLRGQGGLFFLFSRGKWLWKWGGSWMASGISSKASVHLAQQFSHTCPGEIAAHLLLFPFPKQQPGLFRNEYEMNGIPWKHVDTLREKKIGRERETSKLGKGISLSLGGHTRVCSAGGGCVVGSRFKGSNIAWQVNSLLPHFPHKESKSRHWSRSCKREARWHFPTIDRFDSRIREKKKNIKEKGESREVKRLVANPQIPKR